MTDLEIFKRLVAAHDLTYTYSDDGRAYRAGQCQRDEIERLAANLPRAEAAAIWNAEVDRKLVERARQDFYWKAA